MTARVSIDGAAFVDPPVEVTSDGPHRVVVEGSNGTRAEASFVIDTKGPIIALSAPPSPSSDATPTFQFTASEPGELTCLLDGHSVTPCVSPFTTTPLSDGAHTFEVSGVDGLGNPSEEPARVSFTVDATPPETTITSGPTGPTGSTSAAFGLGSEPGATFECKLDAAPDFSPCSTPQSYTGLAQGPHTFSVRAVDTVGNVDPTPATRTWTVDTSPPDTTITPPTPTSFTKVTTASFTFTSEAGATFECKLDTGVFSPCSSPKAYPSLLQGSHAFSVRAIDLAGNVDPTPAAHSWTVDLTAPVATITSGPAVLPVVVNTPGATFVFSATDAFPVPSTLALECALDAAAFSACTSPLTVTVLDGTHTFKVQAKDAAGNVSAVVQRSWTVDATGPIVVISSPALGASYVRSADVDAGFTCTDAPRPAPTCTGAITAGPTGLGPISNGGHLPTGTAGTYTLTVTSTDTAGNTTVATRTYTVADLQGAVAFTRAGQIWVTKASAPGAFAPRQLTQLAGLDTSGSWVDDQPSISPDGRRVIFARRPASPASSNRQIWVIDSTGRNAKNLTGDSGKDYNAPEWSPLGANIVFDSTRSGSKGRDVWTASFSTSSGGTLSSYVNRTDANGDDVTPSWSPGGLRIAFATNRNSSQFEIYSMLANGSDLKRLTNDPRTDIEPSYSPSGLLLAFSSDRATGTGGFELYVMGAPNGNSQTRITTSPGVDGQPHFTDTLTIVFASARTTGGGPGLFTMAPSAVPPIKVPGTTLGDAQPG